MVDGQTNMAAWQRRTGEPLTVDAFEHPPLGANEILIRNRAVAINPLDWLLQDMALLPWLTYPAIVGSDVAGEVAAVGAAVTRFKVGDRVLGQAVGTTIDQPSQGAFQQHTAVFEHMACPLPPAMAFTEAAVLPLGLGTAACGLFQEANLGLPLPSLSPAPTGRVVLVWGASSSVGCNAVQLAAASGHEVVAVASQGHAQLLKQLGAAAVIDHRAPDVVAAVLAALNGKELAGALHATGDIAATLSVVARATGRRKVAVTLAPPPHLPEGVEATAIHGTSLKDDGLGEAIYAGFLPEALAAGRYQAAPPPKVVGTGLEAFQPALEALKAGVSGTKLVVQLA